MSVVCILGRQPALGTAELESRFGSGAVTLTGTPEAALVNTEPGAFPFRELGGTIKAGRVLATFHTTDWRTLHNHLLQAAPEHAQYVPEGKLRIGLSAYGLRASKHDLYHTGIGIKKAIKQTGRSVRLVPNTTLALSSAQVAHNQLTGPTGWELLLIADGHRTILAQTFTVQNIEAYAARDQARPKRDARVGMLPPKLAQIIINLARGQAGPDASPAAPTLLDPFCGTGVILQEAALMGLRVYGTDLEPRMIGYSRVNLEWLHQTFAVDDFALRLEPGDATTHHWTPPVELVACETYLGAPLTTLPSIQQLRDIKKTCDTIHRKFLQNIGRQLTPGTRLCLAVPAWRVGKHFEHLKTLEHLDELGYNRISFEHVATRDLIYYRENQLVARELIVLAKL